MAEYANDILDLDNVNEEAHEDMDMIPSKDSTENNKTKPKKKKSKRESQFKNSKNGDALGLKEGPKLSREERKTLQLLELFEKMEQKEKKKLKTEGRGRKKNNDRSPALSETHTDSQMQEENEKLPETREGLSQISDASSPVLEKISSTKKSKSEPVKVHSRFFNSAFDIGNSPNLISYLYDYQKTNANKYITNKKNKPAINIVPVTNGDHPVEELPILKTDTNQIELLNEQLKKQNEKFLENLRKYGSIQGAKDLRHIFYNLNTK